MYSEIKQARVQEMNRRLLQWYRENSRDLVWRVTTDPYLIWISEIMAQQTRITAVLPYYERFIKQFPTLESLANAELDAVLKAWEGLGYYSRAQNILKTAKWIINELDGVFPTTSKELLTLPGIGEYTAGAIASICFQERVPAVDGNVLRVFARIEDNFLDIGHSATKKLLTGFLQKTMPNDGTEAGIFNQAVMELGALVCVPKTPKCGECPIRELCLGFQKGHQASLPIKGTIKVRVQTDVSVLLIVNSKQEILVRRRTERLLNGLWEFCLVEQSMTAEQVREYVANKGYSVGDVFFIGKATHAFTHKAWEMSGFYVAVAETNATDDFSFVPIADLKQLAMSTAVLSFREWVTGESAMQISLF